MPTLLEIYGSEDEVQRQLLLHVSPAALVEARRRKEKPTSVTPVRSGGARISSGKGSKQDYETPMEFVRSVEKMLGEPFAVDMAATERNAKAPVWIDEERDSFTVNWAEFLQGGLGWLNPPFKTAGLWAEKCAMEAARGWRGVMLTPASVDTNWWANFVHHKARVLFCSPRIQFDGADDPFMKPLALSCYNLPFPEWYQPWRWK